MRPNLSIYAALLLCATASALAVAEDESDERDTPVIRVPSGQYPTIQSAINAAPNHGIVTISGGVFTEALVIQGKSITLRGSENPQSPTEIRAANEIGSLVTFGVGGSGNLRSLTLRGGALGVSAPQPDQTMARQRPCRPPADSELRPRLLR